MIKEELQHKLIMRVEGPFSLPQTLFCGQAFRWKQREDVFYAEALGQYVEVSHQNGELILFSNTPLEKEKWQHYFALDIDYSLLHQKFCQDEVLKKCVENAAGTRVLNQDFFEILITFIISQNNNIPRITSIVDKFCLLFGKEVLEGVYSFPTIEALKDITIQDLEPLRAGFRAKYIIDAIDKVATGKVCVKELNQQTLEQAGETLQTIKGVGPKVSDCVLLFGLGRSEAFPKDVWIKRAMEQLFPTGLPVQCEGVQGIAQQYIFAYARNYL